MKNKLYLLALLAVITMTACEEELPLYQDHQARLNFVYSSAADSVLSYSFVYNSALVEDTIWTQVETIGFVSDTDRPFEIQQIMTGTDDAVAGQHYMSFDDPAYQKFLKIEAGETTARIPIIMYKHSSLSEKDVFLRLSIKENGYFKQGYEGMKHKTLTISNRLVKPISWGRYPDYFFGVWGPVRAQFYIDVTGEKWDEEYVGEILGFNDLSKVDANYIFYLQNKLRRALAEENARRLAAGLGMLAEADGTVITI